MVQNRTKLSSEHEVSVYNVRSARNVAVINPFTNFKRVIVSIVNKPLVSKETGLHLLLNFIKYFFSLSVSHFRHFKNGTIFFD